MIGRHQSQELNGGFVVLELAVFGDAAKQRDGGFRLVFAGLAANLGGVFT